MPSSVPYQSLHLIVAINPRAAFGRHSATGVHIVEALRADGHTVAQCVAPDMAALTELVRSEISENTHGLIVVGGDGMVSFGLNLIAQTELPLGIIPTGTGNDAARGLGIPLGDCDAALTFLRSAFTREPRSLDAGLIHHSGNKTWFFGSVSTGFDALVNERANAMKWPRGASRYTIALLNELVRLRPRTYRLFVDEVFREVSSCLVTLSNNRFIGGGMLITPHAELDDGFLDLFTLRPVSRFTFLRLFPRVFRGTHLSLDSVSVERARRVTFDAPGIVAYADGERVASLPIEVEVVPGAFRIFC